MRAFVLHIVLPLALLPMHAETVRAQRLGGAPTFGAQRSDSSATNAAGFFSSQQSPSGDRLRNPGAQSAASPLAGGAQGGRGEQAFVGRDAEDVRNTFRALNSGQGNSGQGNSRQGRRAMFDMLIENLNEMRDSRRRRQNRQALPLPVRLSYRAAFDYTALAPAAVADKLQGRFQKGIHDGADGPVPQIELVGRKATIRGVARNEHQRRVIGQLVALEPGVSQVENMMEVVER